MKQPRDSKGRFLSWDGTRNRKYTRNDIIHAFRIGLADRGMLMSQAKKIEIFMRQYD